MEAGKLRNRITFQRNTPTANSIGEYVDTYSDYVTVWGEIQPNNGQRFFQSLQANSKVKGVIRIRYRSDILSDMRIKFGSRYFYIDSIVNRNEANEELNIYYKEDLD